MSPNLDKHDADMVRRAAILVANFAKATQTLPAELVFSLGVVIGAALRNVPMPREDE